jgi:hypothetical protein
VGSMARMKQVARNHIDREPSSRVVVVAAMAQRDWESISSTHAESIRGDRDITYICALSK